MASAVEKELKDAIDKEDFETMERLIRSQPDLIGCRTDHGYTALNRAAWLGKLEFAQYLLGQGSSVNCTDMFGYTPLVLAADKGNHRICELLLKAGAQVNHQTQFGWTALHYAAYKGRLPGCQLLLKAGARMYLKTKWVQETPLDLAKKENHTEVVALLERTEAALATQPVNAGQVDTPTAAELERKRREQAEAKAKQQAEELQRKEEEIKRLREQAEASEEKRNANLSLEDCSVEDVCQLFAELGLSQYVDAVHKERVDGALLIMSCEENEFSYLGIQKCVDTMRIRSHVRKVLKAEKERVLQRIVVVPSVPSGPPPSYDQAMLDQANLYNSEYAGEYPVERCVMPIPPPTELPPEHWNPTKP